MNTFMTSNQNFKAILTLKKMLNTIKKAILCTLKVNYFSNVLENFDLWHRVFSIQKFVKNTLSDFQNN